MSDGMARDNTETGPTGAGDSASRYEQTYPELTARDIERLRRFGEIKRYADRESLFEVGKPTAGMFVVLSGHVCIAQRDGLGHVTPVIEQGPGQFLAEVSQLSGRAPLVDGYAEGEVEVLAIPPENLRRLLVAEAELGERIMRALMLRRVNLIRSGTAGPVLIGASSSPNLIRLQGFLTRNGFPLLPREYKNERTPQNCRTWRHCPKASTTPRAKARCRIAPSSYARQRAAACEANCQRKRLHRDGRAAHDLACGVARRAGIDRHEEGM